MKRFLIERDISGVGNLSAEQLKGVAAKSNSVLAKLEIQPAQTSA